MNGTSRSCEICVEHPVDLFRRTPVTRASSAVMRAAPGLEPIGKAQEVHLVDGVQHLYDGTLEDLVFQRSDAERPLAARPASGCTPFETAWPGSALCAPCGAGPEVGLQVLAVGPPRDPVYPRCSPRAYSQVGLPETVDVDVVQQRCEPRCPCPSLLLGDTFQPVWHAWPGTVSGACRAGRVPLGEPPSLHRFRYRSHGFVQRLHRYYGAV